MILTDTHLHTSFSSDSQASMESMVLQGIRLGFRTLCFTEHFDPDFPMTPDGLDFQLDFDAYYDAWLSMKEKYSPKIELLHGVELGVQPDSGPSIEYFYKTYGGRYDFIINSCHLVDKTDPYDGDYFGRLGAKQGLMRYFETIYDNLRLFTDYQAAGHLDYAARYLPKPRPRFHYDDYGEILDAILELVIGQGKALEVNTAGLKAGLAWPNPHMDILRRYRELGGELITIGSDGHRPEHMAWAFDRLPEILQEAGFHYYAVYRQKEPCFLPVGS